MYDTVQEFYFSPAGTTKTVTDRIVSGISSKKKCCDLLACPEDMPEYIDNTDCVVVGMPVYAGRIPAVCAEQLKKLKGSNTPAIVVVVYGNRDYDDALLELKNSLESNGFVVIAAAAFVAQHSIFPVVAKGRPDQADMQKIDSFSKQCAENLQSFSDGAQKKIEVTGSFPYRKPIAVPLKPTGNSDCNGCGACVRVCPVHAIQISRPRETDKNLCISCTACIAVCPQHARGFHGPMHKLAQSGFAKKCAARKEPEIFL